MMLSEILLEALRFLDRSTLDYLPLVSRMLRSVTDSKAVAEVSLRRIRSLIIHNRYRSASDWPSASDSLYCMVITCRLQLGRTALKGNTAHTLEFESRDELSEYLGPTMKSSYIGELRFNGIEFDEPFFDVSI